MKAKFSWRDVKKQQQNRQKGQGQEEVTHEGQRGSSTQEVHSFRSVIEQDKATSGSQHKDALAISVKTPKPAVKGSPVSSSPASLSWGLQRSNRNQVTTGSPTLKINPTKGVTSPQAWSSAGPTSPESPEKPWSGEIIQSPTSPICSFYDIIEEQAIQDLLIHYKAADSVEERITVEHLKMDDQDMYWSSLPGLSKKVKWPVKLIDWEDAVVPDEFEFEDEDDNESTPKDDFVHYKQTDIKLPDSDSAMKTSDVPPASTYPIPLQVSSEADDNIDIGNILPMDVGQLSSCEQDLDHALETFREQFPFIDSPANSESEDESEIEINIGKFLQSESEDSESDPDCKSDLAEEITSKGGSTIGEALETALDEKINPNAEEAL
ncbi:hypothetical protein MAR_018840, partial [Mya arenaria]